MALRPFYHMVTRVGVKVGGCGFHQHAVAAAAPELLQQLHARDLDALEQLAREDLRRAAVAEGLGRAAEGVLLGAVERGRPGHVGRGADGVQRVRVERADRFDQVIIVADDSAERLSGRVASLKLRPSVRGLRRVIALPRQYARSVMRYRRRLLSQFRGDGLRRFARAPRPRRDSAPRSARRRWNAFPRRAGAGQCK